MPPKKRSANKSGAEKPQGPAAADNRRQPGFPGVNTGASADCLETLARSEERSLLFQGILRSTSDGILAVNRENKVLFANERFIEMWKIPPEIMASRDDTLLLQFVIDQLSTPRDFIQKVGELYNLAEESFDTLNFKDGRVFERLSRPMLQGMELQGRVWSFRDMTGRRQIEDALAASEAELRALFASMHDVVLVIDRQGIYRKIAPTNPGLLVKPPGELLGMNLGDVFPAEKAGTFLDVMQQVLVTKRNRQIEYELIIDGRTVWFQATISPLDADSTLWVAHDITNRKQAEEALRTAESKYHSIFENATVGIYQSTPQGSFLSVNPVMARIFGFETPEDMLHGIASIENQYYLDPADRHRFQQLLMEEGEVREFISRNKRKDGGIIWVQENARLVRGTDGGILHYEGFVTDITGRKQAEEELRQAKDRVETANLDLQRSLERETHLSCTDGLTGLYNHRYFFELAAREFHTSVRHQNPLCILMFDMDDFKRVNDTLGHTLGDKLLTMVAQSAVAQVRASDVVARYGGDEFIILLPHANAQQALPVAERIRASIAGMQLNAAGSDEGAINITLSIGIAEMAHEPGEENIERVIQHADTALYEAKRSGRNRTVVFNPDEEQAI